MKVQQLRKIANTLGATVSDRRKITALLVGIRNYSDAVVVGAEKEAIAKFKLSISLAIAYSADRVFVNQLKAQKDSMEVFDYGNNPFAVVGEDQTKIWQEDFVG